MKTSLTTKTLAALLIMANISIACGNNNPNIYKTGSGMNESYSTYLANVDGDSVKAEKSQVTENTSKVYTSATPVETQLDFSYLRFDINQYVAGSESEITELPAADFDYLRFNVNKYTVGSESVITELPVSDFDYLRFEVNNLMEQNSGEIEEMPVNDQLRFDVNKYIEPALTNDGGIGALPSAE